MSTTSQDIDARRRIIRLWLLAVAALMVATLVVGGATRLTESGLSIVEWKPLTGVVPPLDEPAWQAEFDKYKTIPQFRERNFTMRLSDFKVIYWWEWAHRMLARLVGAAFLLPFLIFLWRGWVEPALQARLWTIFALGGALGAVGWWMVASGLADRVRVSQYRLAFHLTLACAIFAMIVWTAQRLASRSKPAANVSTSVRVAALSARIRVTALLLVVMVLVQIYLGALVTGLRAGLLYNTWPLIDGALVPAASQLLFEEPWWRNVFENPLTVQFDHRMLAYAIWLVAVLHIIDVARVATGEMAERRWLLQRGGAALTGALALGAAVTLQAVLGIVTLIQQAPLSLALLHQGVAIAVLAVAVVHGERLAHDATATAAPQPASAPAAAARAR